MNRQLGTLAVIFFYTAVIAAVPARAGEQATAADGELSLEELQNEEQTRREQMNSDLASEIRDFQRGNIAVRVSDVADEETLAMEENMYRQMALDSAPQCLDLDGRQLIDCVENAIESAP